MMEELIDLFKALAIGTGFAIGVMLCSILAMGVVGAIIAGLVYLVTLAGLL